MFLLQCPHFYYVGKSVDDLCGVDSILIQTRDHSNPFSLRPSIHLPLNHREGETGLHLQMLLVKRNSERTWEEKNQFRGQIQSQFRLDRILRPIYSTRFLPHYHHRKQPTGLISCQLHYF